MFLHGHHGQCVSNHIIPDRRIFCIRGKACEHADARGASGRKRVSACLQAVCRLYQLSKNDASPPSEKKPFYIIPDPFVMKSIVDACVASCLFLLAKQFIPLQRHMSQTSAVSSSDSECRQSSSGSAARRCSRGYCRESCRRSAAQRRPPSQRRPLVSPTA